MGPFSLQVEPVQKDTRYQSAEAAILILSILLSSKHRPFINSRASHPQEHFIPLYSNITKLSSFFTLVEMFSTTIFSAIAFTALWSACVSAYPSAKPNVALFNLPAAITPPAGEVLKAVYLGYGTHLMNPRIFQIY